MKLQSHLGDYWGPLEQTWQNAEKHLDRLGREQTLVDDDGYKSTIIAAAADETGKKLAWVETREKQIRARFHDVSHKLHFKVGDDEIGKWELPSYNPFFGCEVCLFEWHSDQIAIIYYEKHKTIIAIYDSLRKRKPRLRAIDDEWFSDSENIYYQSSEPGLIEVCRLPDLQVGAPAPIGVDSRALRFEPKPDQSVDQIAARIAELLFGDHPPQPFADIIIGAAAFRLWDRWPETTTTYSFERRWSSPYWFPFYWYQVVDEESRAQILDNLEGLASNSYVSSESEDYAITMAAERLCRSAEEWYLACEANSLPEDLSCYYGLDRFRQEFSSLLKLFPEGFQQAYKQLVAGKGNSFGSWVKGLFGA